MFNNLTFCLMAQERCLLVWCSFICTDFPGRSVDNSQRTNSEKKKETITKAPPIVEESNVLIDNSLFTDNGSAILGLIVGLLLVLIAVIAAILCGVLMRKRK